MLDPRIEKYADVLLNYCIKLKKGEIAILAATPLATDLVKELFRQSLLIGAYPTTRIVLEGIDEIFFKNASKEQLEFVSPIRKFEIEKVDALVSIMSSYNTKALSNIDPKKQALNQKSNSGIMRRLMERTAKEECTWVGCLYPTFASAQDAGMSLVDYENFVFGACMLDKKDPVAEWRKVSKYNSSLIKYLSRKKSIRVVAPDTDLTYKVTGRKWLNCDGSNNFPDGEVFTGPLEDSANGHIRFSFPAIYAGREVEDVRIEFKDGKAIKATAVKGEKFLNTMLDMDKGARYLGEVAIGTNHGIQKFTRNILFDEKIGGTVHMALGQSYPESGGKNKSGLHWDLLCDLRKSGELYADGELFFKNGKFLK